MKSLFLVPLTLFAFQIGAQETYAASTPGSGYNPSSTSVTSPGAPNPSTTSINPTMPTNPMNSNSPTTPNTFPKSPATPSYNPSTSNYSNPSSSYGNPGSPTNYQHPSPNQSVPNQSYNPPGSGRPLFAASTPGYNPSPQTTSVTSPGAPNSSTTNPTNSNSPTNSTTTPNSPSTPSPSYAPSTPSYSNSQHSYGAPGSPVENYQRPSSTQPAPLPAHSYGPPGSGRLLSEANRSTSTSSTGVVNTPATKDKAKTEADRLLNKKIRDQINGGFDDSFPDLVLVTSDGKVVIEGYVSSTESHDKLQKNIAKVEGVKSVINNATVKSHH